MNAPRFPSYPGGGGDDRGLRDMLRWRLQRWRNPVPPDPPASAFERGDPDPAHPAAPPGELRATWVGHATFLLQFGGLNVLTDPVWSERASPLRWAGPTRLVPAALPFERLPPIDVVLLSHDHYDHLDDATVGALHERWGDRITWVTPLRYARWLGRRGIRRVAELDWWQSASFRDGFRITAAPARHWTRRGPWDAMRRHWASFALAAPDGTRVYFAGDSGYAPFFCEVGERCGPFTAVLMPIGAYEPRWFMHAAHMNPEEAVQAWVDLGETGVFIPMHWGTFRLTDEGALEPPRRLRAAWSRRALPAAQLRVLRHGETLRLGHGDAS